ncbi:hypothetical protein C8R45DRAFT_1107099 [Mycena sanguinolenta]|nr:hypothetical protein C8R45DRAFT_1107099 [Mycena sanguinolenta]
MTLGHFSPVELLEPPWSLALVCWRWRDITVAQTCLWSSFDVHTSPYYSRKGIHRNPDDSTQALERCQEQLRRTEKALLHVSIKGNFKIIPQTLHALRDVCERWETLSIRKTSDFLDEIRGRLLMLRGLHVSGDNKVPIAFGFSRPFPEAYDLISRTFSPRYLAKLDGENLTRYDGPIEWNSFLDLIRRATRLVECRLVFDTMDESDPLPLAKYFCFPLFAASLYRIPAAWGTWSRQGCRSWHLTKTPTIYRIESTTRTLSNS